MDNTTILEFIGDPRVIVLIGVLIAVVAVSTSAIKLLRNIRAEAKLRKEMAKTESQEHLEELLDRMRKQEDPETRQEAERVIMRMLDRLDELERGTVLEGLLQPSEKGRINYIRKLLDEGIKAYLKSLMRELSNIRDEMLPRKVHDKYTPDTISEELKALLKDKEKDFERLIARIKNTKYWADPEIVSRIAIYNYSCKNYETAIENLKRVLHLNPNMKNIHLNLGVCHIMLENWDEAIKCFESSIERGDNKAESFYNLGWLWDEKENYEKAIYYYERSLETNREDHDSAYNKACAFAKWGKEDEAMRELEKIIDIEEYKKLALIDDDLKELRKKGKIESLIKRHAC